MSAKAKIRGKSSSPGRDRPGEYIGFRAPVDLKAKLEGAAKTASRSLSSEAQFRLERSFAEQQLLPEVLELAFGAQLGGLLLAIGAAASEMGPIWAVQNDPKKNTDGLTGLAGLSQALRRANADWINDPYAYRQFIIAVNAILRTMQPPGPVDQSPEMQKLEAQYGGDALAALVVSEFVKPTIEPIRPNEKLRAQAREMIGADLLQRIRK